MEHVLQQFRERILAASAAGTSLRLRGGGSKDWYGQSLEGEILDTRAYSGIIAYEPTELVITARCGTPLAEIEAALAAQSQMLAFEPPHFGAATVGGMVAAGLSGPRRQAVGAVRDFVLGAVVMDGRGEVLHFGGQVMKNVAGYDVSRAMAGSLGTLGLILEVSLKVLPVPYAESTLHLSMSQADALRALNTWGGQPLPISASMWQEGNLLVRLSGAKAAVIAAMNRLGGESIEQAPTLWAALREQKTDFFADATQDGQRLWRLSVPSVAPELELPGAQLIEWGGAQRWLKSTATTAEIREAVTRVGGHATLFRRVDGEAAAEVFHPLAPTVGAIQRRLMQGFDPAGVFNRGRMYAA
jgi:glycolate oxidase FAD binding subunit